ncbi:MAG: zinc ribbon domain-containing protein [Candidatus Dormibacteria bacterium]
MIAADAASVINIVVVAVVIYLGMLWLALAFYVVRDARRRSPSPLLLVIACVLGFVPPFLGALVYIVLRPPRTIEEERAFAIEEQAFFEPGLDGTGQTRPCPTCGRDIEQDFIVCPYCRTQFARRCTACDRALRLGWAVCPYCATEVGAPPLSRTAL